MKKLLLLATVAGTLFLGSCSSRITNAAKESVPFPGMVVNRSDYKLSKDVTAEVEVKEFSTLFGVIRSAKVIGENKNETRQGAVQGYALDPAAQIAAYRLLDANPGFDYLTNIRVKKEYSKKWCVLFTKYSSKVYITAKGITLNTEK